MKRQGIGMGPVLGAAFTMAVLLAGEAAQAQWAGGTPELPFNALVSVDQAQLRAEPGESSYVVGTFPRGQRLRVVDVSRGWCQVVPPPGVYSYVSKSAITRGQGKEGTVSVDDIVVYVAAQNGGPQVSQKVHRKLFKGAKVIIQGEEGDKYRIIPPDGSYVWVPADQVAPEQAGGESTGGESDRQASTPIEITLQRRALLVDGRQMPVRDLTRDLTRVLQDIVDRDADRSVVIRGGEGISDVVVSEWVKSARGLGLTNVSAGPAAGGTEDTSANTSGNGSNDADNQSTDANTGSDDTTNSATDNNNSAATTSQDTSDAERKLEAAEKRFLAMIDKPLEEQPIDQMLETYQELKADESLGRRGKQIVELRLFQLGRSKMALDAIRDLEQASSRLEKEQTPTPDFEPGLLPVFYNLKGTLVASAVYNGTSLPRLFRLTADDGVTTIAYVRAADVADPAKMLGARVGIVGKVVMDEQLKVQLAQVERIDVLTPAGSDEPQQPASSTESDDATTPVDDESVPAPVQPKPAEVIED